jgi:hypothetical protein
MPLVVWVLTGSSPITLGQRLLHTKMRKCSKQLEEPTSCKQNLHPTKPFRVQVATRESREERKCPQTKMDSSMSPARVLFQKRCRSFRPRSKLAA